MKNEKNNKEFGRGMRQSQSRFLSKKMAWENSEPLTVSELAERKFWKDELKIMVIGSKGNLITSAESKEYFRAVAKEERKAEHINALMKCFMFSVMFWSVVGIITMTLF